MGTTTIVRAARWIRTAAICGATCMLPAWAAEPPAPLVGPKRTVVVDKFSSLGTFTAAYGEWDVGGGLAAMLTTALDQSGRFVVLERANLERVAFEQQLKAKSAANPETGPRLGRLTGAQFVVIGAVTEFGTQDKGSGISLGLPGFGKQLGGLIGARQTEGAVTLDLRIVDTTTGQIVQTLKVKEPISTTSVSMGVNYRGMTLGGDSFDNTPLGEATRQAIEKAVAEIVAVSARQPWRALVVEFDGRDIAINSGSAAGVKVGDRFDIERITNPLTDPATGEVLSVRRKGLGTLVITGVEAKVAYGPFKSSDPDAPVRGDVVVLSP
jgi:curli biogenesis system outer membrane secretion channel CsgG